MIANLIRIGTVERVDLARARARVRLGNDLVTDDLAWLSAAGDTKTWRPPTIGEQVIVLSPSGELAAGVILAGMYRASKPAPSTMPDNQVVFADGSKVTWEDSKLRIEAAGDLTITAVDNLTIEAGGDLVVRAADTTVEGENINLEGSSINANRRIDQP